mgnify:FL=1|jgi:hypothetical protein
MTVKKKRRRVLVTVSPEMYELVQAVSNEANVATSNLLGEMIEECKPAFEAMLAAVRQAKNKNADTFDTLQRLLISAQSQVTNAQIDLLDEQKKLRRQTSEK